jgi:hypothetical protein
MMPWTPDDDATLAELYRQFSARECAARRPGGVQVLQNDRNGKTTVEERDGVRITRHIAK